MSYPFRGFIVVEAVYHMLETEIKRLAFNVQFYGVHFQSRQTVCRDACKCKLIVCATGPPNVFYHTYQVRSKPCDFGLLQGLS